MGLFDTLLVTVQDDAVGVQTKRLGEGMASFRPGDRLVPAAEAPGWQVFVEEFHLGDQWFDPSVQRLLVVLTWNGVWLDHAIALPSRQEAVTAGLMRVWRDPRYAAWAHGRWAEWFADLRAADEMSWRAQWNLLQDWQGGIAHRLTRNAAPLGPLNRETVTATMELVLVRRGQMRLRHEITWPALMGETPDVDSPNGSLFDDEPRGFMPVPPLPEAGATRWSLAAAALDQGDWCTTERLVHDDRPTEPVPAWQAVLDRTLAAVMPSTVLQPVVQRLLAWGAMPPEEVQEQPLPQWAVGEQGWGVPLLVALREACPHLDWSGLWPWWGRQGYRQAWAQRPEAQRWGTTDLQDWLVRCAHQPTASMASLPPDAWQPWLDAGGRLSADTPEQDPLARMLDVQNGANAAHVQWLVEHRDRAGWHVPHLPVIAARLQERASTSTSNGQDWGAAWRAFEQVQLRLSAPKVRKPRTPTARKRL